VACPIPLRRAAAGTVASPARAAASGPGGQRAAVPQGDLDIL